MEKWQRTLENVFVTPDGSLWKSLRVLVTGHANFKSRWLTIWLNWLGTNVTGITQVLYANARERHTRRMAVVAGPGSAEAAVDEMAVIAKWDRVFVSMGFDFTRDAEKLP